VEIKDREIANKQKQLLELKEQLTGEEAKWSLQLANAEKASINSQK
jgi:hypothetical protein